MADNSRLDYQGFEVAVHFDAGALAPNDRAEAIREFNRRVNGLTKVDLPSNPAHMRASATTSALGSVEISDVDWNVANLRRTPAPMKDDVDPHFFLAVGKSGVSRYTQGGRTTHVGPGDLVLLENYKPYTVSFLGDVLAATVRVPTQALGIPSSLLGQVTAVRLGHEPLVDAVAAFFARLIRNQTAFSDAEGDVFAQSAIEMIRAVVATRLGRDSLARGPLQHTLLERVLTYVRLHLAERDLSAARIAADHYVSVRQIYLTLSQAGISLGSWVRTERLKECRRDLAAPENFAMTIEDIAHRWAFRSMSHFSRSFKEMYGMSPREWRQTSLHRPSE